ncbi:MAG: response regulator [Candidatus Rokubacteria bacterium]|nr:response regulator [Candidatus Rokubacteria bacterium]
MSQTRWIAQGPESAPLVFLVEDDADLARCFQLFLQRGGFRTASAETASDGLDGIRTLRPALAIVDLWLRSREGAALQSGADLIRALGEDPALRDLRVIVMTGDVPEPDQFGDRAVQFVAKAAAAADPTRLPDLVRRRLASPPADRRAEAGG